MAEDRINAYEFHPEWQKSVMIDGIYATEVWRPDIQDTVSAISLSRLRRGKVEGSDEEVLVPDDEHFLNKIAWAARDLGPRIKGSRLLAGSVSRARVKGDQFTFLKAAFLENTSEMLWRVNTGLWGNTEEVLRLRGLMRGGDINAPLQPLFHGCYALEAGDQSRGEKSEEIAFAEHATLKHAHGHLVSRDMMVSGKFDWMVPLGDQSLRISSRRTYLWRNFDGFKLAVIGCVPDSGFILINDRGKKREERPHDQKKFRVAMEEKAWNDREAARSKRTQPE